ncbi:DUF202 domain-containing protein [Amycolatopsis regifaucium]|uniref:Uncharacterized protein n=1 Tax=Amycolatopsis regifaucium TaxID=546365 RepID=A0A154MAN9_9PSEU|nr:DUF202 domain-containing protein [Amycolatopsis regifaucium]KZB81357.1 hypothetical protein AVL48_04885 [Amycolatopsis regifaucium]OKA04622.1 hypothetical protein ATP06_0229895 [Amycolatopsis regifaucium]SFH33626.1 protein of unknown function [Amycolatopsis regifaucium]
MSDHGAQAQRTGLAWRRTALAATACTLLLLHLAARRGWGTAVIPVVFAGAMVITLAVTGAVRERALRRAGTPKPLNPALAVTVSALVVATAATLIAVR